MSASANPPAAPGDAGAPSKKNDTGACRIVAICCNRLAPIRFAPFSYFWICWNVSPSASPSFSWLMPSIRRRMRTRLPTYLSTGFGAFIAMRLLQGPARTRACVTCGPAFRGEAAETCAQRYHRMPSGTIVLARMQQAKRGASGARARASGPPAPRGRPGRRAGAHTRSARSRAAGWSRARLRARGRVRAPRAPARAVAQAHIHGRLDRARQAGVEHAFEAEAEFAPRAAERIDHRRDAGVGGAHQRQAFLDRAPPRLLQKLAGAGADRKSTRLNSS